MKPHTISVGSENDSEFEHMIGAGLDEFNTQAGGATDRCALTVIVRDPDSGAAVGGIVGRTSLGLAFLDLFYLPASLRGSGLGTQVLKAFEDEARARGCSAAVLYTISFQAPGFYSKNGWVGFGEVRSERQGVSRVFMSKQL